MSFYLYEHPNPHAPVRSNGIKFWGYPTRQGITGPRVIVMHTAENLPDVVPPDRGAEAIANYFANTTRPVSAHSVTDSDSTIRLLPDTAVGFHVRRYNTPGYGIEIATQAARWDTLPLDYRAALLSRAATDAARVATRWSIPVRFLTKSQIDNGASGFTGHTNLDPDRRTDPGWDLGDWTHFLQLVRQEQGMTHQHTIPPEKLPRAWATEPWVRYVAAGGSTIPESRVWEAYREDLAHYYVTFTEPIESDVSQLQRDLVHSNARIAQLEQRLDALTPGGAHDHDDNYVRLGQPVTIEGN